MAIPVEMPKMSDTMEEGVLVAWLVDEGASISAGDIIAQVETDKATMDLEAYDDGVLLKRVIDEGQSVPIGALIAVLGDEGEDISSLLDQHAAGASQGDGVSASTGGMESAAVTSGDGSVAVSEPDYVPDSGGSRIRSSPLARRLAHEFGVSLGGLQGTGPDGRIVKRDVMAVLESGATATAPQPVQAPTPSVAPPSVAPPAGAPPAAQPRPAVPRIAPAASLISTPAAASTPPEVVRVSQMRKAIGRRLSQSKFTAPHFYLTIDVAMDRTVEARREMNALAEQSGVKVSFNDFVTKACALALRAHPAVNASYKEEQGEIHHHRHVHVAVAVAIDDGLMTPVIRNADQKGLQQISVETRNLAARARERKLQPEDYEGSTFTTSNLGMFGIQEFTAIINPPNACILAIGSIRDEPVVLDGAVVPGKRMKVTLSCDHRVVDGATGAQFLETVRQYLESPVSMLL